MKLYEPDPELIAQKREESRKRYEERSKFLMDSGFIPTPGMTLEEALEAVQKHQAYLVSKLQKWGKQ